MKTERVMGFCYSSFPALEGFSVLSLNLSFSSMFISLSSCHFMLSDEKRKSEHQARIFASKRVINVLNTNYSGWENLLPMLLSLSTFYFLVSLVSVRVLCSRHQSFPSLLSLPVRNEQLETMYQCLRCKWRVIEYCPLRSQILVSETLSLLCALVCVNLQLQTWQQECSIDLSQIRRSNSQT